MIFQGQDKTDRKQFLQSFRKQKLPFYLLVCLLALYLLTFFLPLIVNNNPLMIIVNGKTYYPAVNDFIESLPPMGFFNEKSIFVSASSQEFPVTYDTETGQDEKYQVFHTIYPFGPCENVASTNMKSLAKPFSRNTNGYINILGTDGLGRDILARTMYGFNISFTIGLILTLIEFIIGVGFGASLGYLGNKSDLIIQRAVEVWFSIPVFFLLMVIGSHGQLEVYQLVLLIALFRWLNVALIIRAEFYKEKKKEYVYSSVMMGYGTPRIIFGQILPNALIPVLAYLPVNLAGNIITLVGLDFLGFGLPPGSPSLGQMISDGLNHLSAGNVWIILPPLLCLIISLITIFTINNGIMKLFYIRNH